MGSICETRSTCSDLRLTPDISTQKLWAHRGGAGSNSSADVDEGTPVPVIVFCISEVCLSITYDMLCIQGTQAPCTIPTSGRGLEHRTSDVIVQTTHKTGNH